MGSESEPTFLGRRIREARERMNWSQTRLAEAAKFGSAQTISTIENGTRDVKAYELARIADVLHLSLNALLSQTDETSAAVQWRDRPTEDFEEVEARFLLRCERFATLESLCGVPSCEPLPKLTLRALDYAIAARAADELRNKLQLGSRPACSLAKTLDEDWGVKLFVDDLGEKGSGLCASGTFGQAVLLNSRNAASRRNFTLAHELFHLLMPDPQNNAGEIERYANAFASALLLPAEPLLLSCDSKSSGGKLSFESIVSIAVEFGVSTDALLWRLVNLRRIRRESVESAISSRVLKAIERSSQPQSSYQTSALPDRYVRLAYQAFRLGKIGLAKLAEFLEQGMFELAAQQDLQPEMEHGEQAEIAVVGC